MRSRRLAMPPRCGSKWSARCSNALTAVSGMSYLLYLCSTGPPHDGTRQDQVGWSEGGPQIVISQYTFCRRRVGAGRLQTHGGTVNIAN